MPALAEASGVSRTLAAADEQKLTALQTTLAAIAQPFLNRALADLRTRQQPLVLDADLTGRPVSSTSHTYPDAAFGYMDGQLRLGYQVAAICVQTDLYGRQWLAAFQHPGDTVSAPCLTELVYAAEGYLGGHPRRRPDLLDRRIAVAMDKQTLWEQRGPASRLNRHRNEMQAAMRLHQAMLRGHVAQGPVIDGIVAVLDAGGEFSADNRLAHLG